MEASCIGHPQKLQMLHTKIDLENEIHEIDTQWSMDFINLGVLYSTNDLQTQLERPRIMRIACKREPGQELALLRDCSRSLAGPTNFFLARNTQSTTSNRQTPRKTGPDQFMFAAVTGI